MAAGVMQDGRSLMRRGVLLANFSYTIFVQGPAQSLVDASTRSPTFLTTFEHQPFVLSTDMCATTIEIRRNIWPDDAACDAIALQIEGQPSGEDTDAHRQRQVSLYTRGR